MQHFTSPHAVFISTQYNTTVVYRGGWYTANMFLKPCMQFKGMNSWKKWICSDESTYADTCSHFRLWRVALTSWLVIGDHSPTINGTAQRQGNICICPRRVLHMFWTHPASDKKRHGNRVSLVAALSWGFALARMCLVSIPDASCTYTRDAQTLPWSWAVP